MISRKKGFTLIELLVVIAIIALLLSILTPALNSVKERGRRVVCMSNLKQLSLANIMYAQLYNGRFVPLEDNSNIDGGGYDIILPNGEVFTPQYGVWCLNKTFIKLLDQTGTDNVGYNIGSGLGFYYGLPRKFRCPSYPSKKASVSMATTGGSNVLQTSYGINETDIWLAPPGAARDAMIEIILEKGPLSDGIKRPADKLLFTDALNPSVTYAQVGGDYQGNYVNHWDEHGEFFGWDDAAVHRIYGGTHVLEPMYRHSEGANIAFCDGHVEYRKKTEMFYFLDGNRPNLAATNVDVARNDKLWCYFR